MKAKKPVPKEYPPDFRVVTTESKIIYKPNLMSIRKKIISA